MINHIILECGDKSLEVHLENGIYFLGTRSGTGKTYLGVVTKALRSVGYIDVFYVTYIDGATSNIYIDLIKEAADARVIIIDRYNMYESEDITNYLLSLSKDKIVLVDDKYYRIHGKTRTAIINRYEDKTVIGV